MLSQTPRSSSAPITFRHFCRKGYALFACLGREVRVGVLGAATLACAAPCLQAKTLPVLAESHAADSVGAPEQEVDEVVVLASRTPMAANLVARQVMTLSRQDLEAAGVTSINDLLKLAVGIDVRQRGGFGMQTDISINGGTHDQIAILINGVPISNPHTGHNAADFPVNLSDIQRVEILEGAASRVLGSQAFSGAINVITRPDASASNTAGASPHAVKAEVAAGSYATVLGEAMYAYDARRKGRLHASVSGSGRRSDGAVTNSDFRGTKWFGQLAYDHRAFTLAAQAGTTINDFGANTFYSAAYPNQWEATQRHLTSVTADVPLCFSGPYKRNVTLHLSPQVAWMRNLDHFQLIRNTPTGENFHRTDVLTTALNAWLDWQIGRTSVGGEWRREEIISSNLGRPRALPSGHYNFYDGRSNVSLYAEQSLILRAFTLSVGFMAERNTAIDNRFRFYPGVDLSYRIAPALRLYASWNRSLRLPTFTDLYYKSPTQQGNVGLRPEECSAWNLGVYWLHRLGNVKAKVYYNRGTNMIDWVMFSADDKYHATNFQLDNVGLSLTSTLHLDRQWGTRQPLRRLTLGYAYIHQHRRDDQAYFKSNYAMEYLRHKATASLEHRIWRNLSATWNLRVQDRAGAYLVYKNGQNTGELQPYGVHAILDGRLQWQMRRWKVYADVTNITNTRYFDLGNVRQAGTMVMVGGSLTL